MNWFRKIFGAAPAKVASSKSDREWLRQQVQSFASFQMANMGVEVVGVQNTNSMLPVLDENTILLVESCGYDALTAGDIVIYRMDPTAWGGKTGTVCHRLREKTRNGWWACGDACTRMDNEVVTPENFQRRVMAVFYGRRTDQTDL